MSDVFKTYKISDTKELRILLDDMGDSPRNWDNATTMICLHSRYRLGDDHDLRSEEFDGWDELKNYLEKEFNILMIKPLYLYDHSGVTISTTPFSCRWDSGQVGWVYIENDAEESLAELFEEKLEKIIEEEVKIYDQYIRGDVYGFQLVEKSTCSECETAHEEVVDSCWGFYGDDIEENGILEHLSEEDRKAILQQV